MGHSKGAIHHHQHGEDEGNSDNDDEDDSSTSSTSDFYESLALDDDAVDFVDYNTYGAKNGDDTDKVLEAMLEKKDDISLSSDGNAVTSGAPAKNVLKQDSTFEKDISMAGEEKKSASSSALLGHSKGAIHHHQHGEDEGNSDNDDEDDSSTSSTSDFYETLALDDDAVDFVDYNTYGAKNGDDTDKVLEAMLEKKDDISLSSDGNAVTSGAPAKNVLKQDSTFEKDISMAGEEKKALLRRRFWAIQRAQFIITNTARMKATATTMMKMILLLRLLLISTKPLLSTTMPSTLSTTIRTAPKMVTIPTKFSRRCWKRKMTSLSLQMVMRSLPERRRRMF